MIWVKGFDQNTPLNSISYLSLRAGILKFRKKMKKKMLREESVLVTNKHLAAAETNVPENKGAALN